MCLQCTWKVSLITGCDKEQTLLTVVIAIVGVILPLLQLLVTLLAPLALFYCLTKRMEKMLNGKHKGTDHIGYDMERAIVHLG